MFCIKQLLLLMAGSILKHTIFRKATAAKEAAVDNLPQEFFWKVHRSALQLKIWDVFHNICLHPCIFKSTRLRGLNINPQKNLIKMINLSQKFIAFCTKRPTNKDKYFCLKRPSFNCLIHFYKRIY